MATRGTTVEEKGVKFEDNKVSWAPTTFHGRRKYDEFSWTAWTSVGIFPATKSFIFELFSAPYLQARENTKVEFYASCRRFNQLGLSVLQLKICTTLGVGS